MTEYNLQILHSQEALTNRDAAIALLNLYEHHRIGQPISLLYMDGSDVRALYAIGKKDGDAALEAGEVNCGPDFYDIISGSGSSTEANWQKLN